jgi:hypothetical protein
MQPEWLPNVRRGDTALAARWYERYDLKNAHVMGERMRVGNRDILLAL